MSELSSTGRLRSVDECGGASSLLTIFKRSSPQILFFFFLSLLRKYLGSCISGDGALGGGKEDRRG